MLTRNKHGTLSRLVLALLLIANIDTISLSSSLQNVRVLLFADAPEKNGNVWLPYYPLADSQRILDASAGDVIRLKLLLKFGEYVLVLWLCEDCIVRPQAVLLQVSCVYDCANVK